LRAIPTDLFAFNELSLLSQRWRVASYSWAVERGRIALIVGEFGLSKVPGIFLQCSSLKELDEVDRI
jgi:hypothetical protein